MTVAMLLAMTAPLGACGFEIVDTGYRGVETEFGKIKGESLTEGLHFYNPFTSNIIELEVRTIRNDNKTLAYTKDIQQAGIAYTVNYHLDATKAHTVFQEVGKNWEEKLVPQVVEGSIKSIIGKWEAVKLIENRQKATIAIFDDIKLALDVKGVIVENFELTNIDYSGDFEKAVEAKVTAIQRASEAKNKTVQIQEEAKQKVIAAQAEAKSMTIRSAALSQNQALIEYEAVMKWDGKLPQYMLGGATPFINVPSSK